MYTKKYTFYSMYEQLPLTVYITTFLLITLTTIALCNRLFFHIKNIRT